MTNEIQAKIKTDKGDIQLRFFNEEAPITVTNFINLAKRGYYDNLVFHRVISNFMIQGGCPLGMGSGGPGYEFEDEFSDKRRHSKAGILSMANRGKATNGSQFFITHGPQPHLDGNHTVFGEVLSSIDQAVIDSIQQGDKILSIEITGDTEGLFEKYKEHLLKWNTTLDSKFPNLKSV